MKINDQTEVMSVANRFMWVDNCTYKFVTNSGIERIISFDAKGNFTEKGFCFVPEFDRSEVAHEHYYTGFNNCMTAEDIDGRLFRKYRKYKQQYYLFQRKTEAEIYPELFNADYYENDCKGRILMDFSFSFLSWKIIE